MPTFEQMWNACSQEEARISIVNKKNKNEEENTLNAYSTHHKRKGTFKSSKDQIRKWTYPRLNVTIATIWDITRVIFLRIQEIRK